ncbi:MAG: hypothetical protein US62_C0037G0006 [Candidatus Woesebacteria bacterium GW2011_GWA1_37_8]|uniref:Carotenoid biosynthesis protein n=2 Tax=Candidatus Woeseibacteriota TaxID=1752722 RepID=A0A0G0L3S1_9BACT|nr:MAG: hypothetical protein US39_C0014G0037 [Microgenomates group bacterium GW2011_GWC1_37_12b]KKQ43969.1 MAG: hypothetical protein US62_C0037G0006 [Candidatus Woesebacteria bacterium GW2011_GWA1_37_8]KKQ86593.1 MAG: hypothetical protein UT10_C0021G0010 [Candidatus Woesebacteria bacterium GW2011_GWB1_38_8b]
MDIFISAIVIFSLLPFLVIRNTKSYFLFTVLSIFAIIIHGIYLFGPSIIYLILATYITSTAAELVSLKTRFNCFGIKYSYALGHRMFTSKVNILGVYPLEISLTWVILKYISFNMALIIILAFSIPYYFLIILTPLILVSIDLVIDPIAVNIAKMWKWEKGSGYFGIPGQNFLGWFLVGLASTYAFSFIGVDRQITPNILFVLPIIFYFLILSYFRLLFRIDKVKAILGALPAIFWTLLSTIGLFTLLLK